MNSAGSILPAPFEHETWRERVSAAFPLFLVGAVCVALGVYLYLLDLSTNFGANGSVHLRPWVLFVALGITGLSAGVVALLAATALEAPREKASAPTRAPAAIRSKERAPLLFGRSRENYPGPTPEERPAVTASVESTRRSSSATLGPGAVPIPGLPVVNARAWDESLSGPTEHRRYPKEVWDESPEEFEAAAAKPAPPAVVLSQLDDIEKSLRKKPSRPRAE